MLCYGHGLGSIVMHNIFQDLLASVLYYEYVCYILLYYCFRWTNNTDYRESLSHHIGYDTMLLVGYYIRYNLFSCSSCSCCLFLPLPKNKDSCLIDDTYEYCNLHESLSRKANSVTSADDLHGEYNGTNRNIWMLSKKGKFSVYHIKHLIDFILEM